MEIPKTVAIIMDGNGRWAKKQGLLRTAGHKKGVEVVRDIALKANELGVEELILYAFSTENWKRSAQEVDYLCRLPEVFFSRFIGELMEKGIKVTFTGDLDAFPENTRKVIENAVWQTRNNPNLVLNLAINYGSMTEMAKAMRDYADAVSKGRENDLKPEEFLSWLSMPKEIDLMIRTGNEKRLSNFFLPQLAYAELVFEPVAWPDYTPADFERNLQEFSGRERRFGGVL